MSKIDVTTVMAFLRDNEIGLSVPGHYDLPWRLVEEALLELAKTGASDRVAMHRKWTYALWDIEKHKSGRGFSSLSEASSCELHEIFELKEYWGDSSDLDLLEDLFNEALERESRQETYAFRRGPGFTVELRKQCIKRDSGKCVRCRANDNLEVDHIVELIDGGENALDNLQTLCRPCHRKKTSESIKARRAAQTNRQRNHSPTKQSHALT